MKIVGNMSKGNVAFLPTLGGGGKVSVQIVRGGNMNGKRNKKL